MVKANVKQKMFDEWFDQELEDSKEIVRKFINDIFGNGNNEDYKMEKFYSRFKIFNFDWFNFAIDDFDTISNECKKANGWYKSYKIPNLEEIRKSFNELTGIQKEKLEVISKREELRGCADPDSMKIVCHILFIVYSDFIKKAIYEMPLKEILNKNIIDLFKGDTMHSFHYSFGNPKYEGKEVKDPIRQYIFMYNYINGFSKINNEKLINEVKKFFNKYHTLGNFVLTPAVTVDGMSINTYRYRFDNDNYYVYLDKVFKPQKESLSILNLLIEANKGFFTQYKDKNEYYNSLNVSCEDGENYTKLREKALENRDNSEYMGNYINKVEEIIDKRCEKMIKKLYNKLKESKEKESV